jgi:formylmethanofuran dehydrogenase subunit E
MTKKNRAAQPPRSWAAVLIALSLAGAAGADEDDHAPALPKAAGAQKTHQGLVQSQPGGNAWNTGRPVEDWWAEIQRQHGHVGAWNVLGWRIGQAALRELKSGWGRHELEIVCYVPPQTPFTCLADGLAVGTGNSLGRLDLRLAEVLDYRQAHVAVRRTDGRGDVLEFRPPAAYFKSITGQPVEALERLSRECARMPEGELFSVQRLAHEP